MKKNLIAVLLLITSLTSFSQNTENNKLIDSSKTKVVKVSTLIAIKRDIDKCELLRIAYDELLEESIKLEQYNLEYISKIEIESNKIEQLQTELDITTEALLENKNKSWSLNMSLGAILGLIIGVIISN